jgi:hypothetical protein
VEDEAARLEASDRGLAKEAKDLDLPPLAERPLRHLIAWAVHGVLQTVDLATGGSLNEATAAQAGAEGVLGKET